MHFKINLKFYFFFQIKGMFWNYALATSTNQKLGQNLRIYEN